jgi:ribA/ribD-fused uncharacterized protein
MAHFDKKLNPVLEKLSLLETSLVAARSEVELASSLAKETEDKCNALEQEMKGLKLENCSLRSDLRTCHKRITALDDYQRRSNLIFEGIPEVGDETTTSLKRKLTETFALLGVPNHDKINLERFHRLGIKAGNKSRPVIVRFSFYSERESIWLARSKLKGSNVFLREDFCKATLQERAKLIPVMKTARQSDHKCTIVGDSLYLDGKKYNSDQLDKLPSYLSATSISSRSDDKSHAFYGRQNPLSNFHISNFTLNDIKFSSAEQCYQYHKAIYFKDNVSASEILKTNDPTLQKRISRQIRDFCEATWELVANDIMHNTLLAKFSNNQSLRDHLCSTGTKSLYEASPHDLYWGIGLSLSNKNVLDTKYHKGLNTLGAIMMTVRDQLKDSSTPLS